MARTTFKNEYYVRIYEMSRQGMRTRAMAAALGVSTTTLKSWRKDDTAVSDAISKGRSSLTPTGSSTGQTFFEYVYKRLPEHLQQLWTEMKACEGEENDQKRLESLLHNQSLRTRQHLFVHALVSSNFNASEACRRICVPRTTFESWCKSDSDFVELMDQIQVMKKDFVEGCLMSQVAAGDVTCTVFANKTLNRDRGYDNKVSVEHTGSILHGVLDLNSLKLPVEVMRVIAEAIQKQQDPETPRLVEAEVTASEN